MRNCSNLNSFMISISKWWLRKLYLKKQISNDAPVFTLGCSLTKISSVSHPSRVVVTPRHHERRCSLRLHHGFRPAPPRHRRYLLRDFRLHPLPSGVTAGPPLLAGGGDYATRSLPSVSPSPHPPARHHSRWAISPKVDGWRARRGQR